MDSVTEWKRPLHMQFAVLFIADPSPSERAAYGKAQVRGRLCRTMAVVIAGSYTRRPYGCLSQSALRAGVPAGDQGLRTFFPQHLDRIRSFGSQAEFQLLNALLLSAVLISVGSYEAPWHHCADLRPLEA
ncbi:hypothetical protein IE4872_CH00173 [Rhizobium gallicum]|uniref:Uncharacterized protein n=2 Tax=Rhizobium gallicum TaxID=56730 RepID=A0A1L5ND78_9HYPH|nr:hypothetical protein IE4872_CH00173 [Rhizobium gallicum]